MSKWNVCQQWLAAGQPDRALPLLRKQLAKSANDALGWFLLGCTHQMRDELTEAEAAFRKSVRINPEPVAPRLNLAGVLLEGFKHGEAEKLLGKLQREAAGLPLVWRYTAKVRLQQERWNDALDAYQKMFELVPDDLPSRFEHALQSDTCKRAVEALVLLEQVPLNGLMPEELAGWRAYLECRAGIRPLESAAAAFNWQPNDLESLTRRTALQVLSLASSGEFDSVVELLDQLSPHFPRVTAEHALSLGMCQLACGNWQAGWQGYSDRSTARIHIEQANELGGHIPIWTGEDIAGKTLLVHCEQGAGDVIQFVRLLPLLEERGVTARLNIQPDMLRLFAGRVASETAYEARGADATQGCDYQVRLLDLPWCLKLERTVLPLSVPYLVVDLEREAHWQARLADITGPKIALVWAGNPNHLSDVHRSAALADFLPLFALPGIQWMLVQKGAGAREARSLPWVSNLIDLGPEINDFQDTAAILSQADLLISVDTSVAHLAGALNRPVWTLISNQGQDWRWEMESSETPWYPSMQLWRRPADQSWAKLICDELLPAVAKRFSLPLSSNELGSGVSAELEALTQIADTDRLVERAHELLARYPDCAEIWLCLAERALVEQRQDDALHCLNEVTVICPRHAQGWLLQARLYRARQDTRAALHAYQRVLFFIGEERQAVLNELADYYETLGAPLVAADCREFAGSRAQAVPE